MGYRSLIWTGGTLSVFFVALVLSAEPARDAEADKIGEALAPTFKVDPFWPKPLPNKWLMGGGAGVAVDLQDHIWVVHRPKTLTEDERRAGPWPARSECCVPAPPVLEFDAEGNLVGAWGGPGPGYEWPAKEHGIFIDYQNNVWIAGNGPKDGQVLKFARDGRFLMRIGEPGVVGDDADTRRLNGPADMAMDHDANDIFIADGYGNHRIIVFDAQTGAYKRHWGANGRQPGDTSVKQFGNPLHCIRIARDGLIYVCDRVNNRIQIFRKDGTFVKEFIVAPKTRGEGSTWEADFSTDPLQTYLYIADGENGYVWILFRESGRILSRFGRSGRSWGNWGKGGGGGHNMAVDSKGNIYTTSGKQRVQKFIFRGTS